MSDLDATTSVTVRMDGRRATIEDLQEAINVLLAEGIPKTFEVDVNQSTERIGDRDVPYADRPLSHTFSLTAERASKGAGG
ncbi:MAG: hypothetical protein H0X12_13510 [Nocardioides sp.]|nr:hypothetical protein [Nocardioides sp.]